MFSGRRGGDPQRREHDHEAHERGEGHEEREPGPHVRAEDEVDRADEQHDPATTTSTPRMVGYQMFGSVSSVPRVKVKVQLRSFWLRARARSRRSP